MASIEEIAEHALHVAQRAEDELCEYLRAHGATDDDAFKAISLIGDQTAGRIVRDSSSRHLAMSLLFSERAAGRAEDPDDAADERTDEFEGYRLMRAGDRAGALAIADALLREAAAMDPDDWDHGNQVHHGHILRGRVLLADGDIAGATAELLQAGDVSGSPHLDSFRPDLWLAWALLRAGQQDVVMTYFQRVATFWTPRD